MSSSYIYVDESGDPGWKFDQPYRKGGSSRYLTIASLIVPPDLRERPKRIIRNLYKKHHWPTSKEKKWSRMTDPERVSFAASAISLLKKHSAIECRAITVYKQNVQPHIRDDANKLYNYMIRLSLIDRMAQETQITLFPDERSLKIKSGNSLHDYLQATLWFDFNVKTILKTLPAESSSNLNVQFADMFAGAVQSHFEDGNSRPWSLLSPHIQSKRLYFP